MQEKVGVHDSVFVLEACENMAYFAKYTKMSDFKWETLLITTWDVFSLTSLTYQDMIFMYRFRSNSTMDLS